MQKYVFQLFDEKAAAISEKAMLKDQRRQLIHKLLSSGSSRRTTVGFTQRQ
jgi:hypothetical protein